MTSIVNRMFIISVLLCTLATTVFGENELLCYVGGTMRPAVDKLAKIYESKYGSKIVIDYSSSGEALIKAKQTSRGDLIVVHDPYQGAIEKQKLGTNHWTVATLIPTIVVPKGNPQKIAGLKDLVKPGMRIILSDPTYSTLGHIVLAMTKKAAIDSVINNVVISRTKGSAEAANAVALGTADAAIVWNAVAFLRNDKLESITIEKRYFPKGNVDAVSSATFGVINLETTRVTVSTLKFSKNPQLAREFASFLASPEASKIWNQMGYGPTPDNSEKVQSSQSKSHSKPVIIHCAAGMKTPVEMLVRQFGSKTGYKIEVNYDGSNRLLGRIELSKKGDIYIAGDADYIEMAQKKGLVKKQITICYFEPVIMVKKFNPLKIKTLDDLTRIKLKIGQGDERAAAIGRLTPKVLKLNNIDTDNWNANVVMKTTTVNELAMAIKLGTIDATIVWETIAQMYPKDSEYIKIPKQKNILPDVGAALLSCSENPGVASEFLNFCVSNDGKAILTSVGYQVEK